MAAAGLFALSLLIALRSWREGRKADPARVPGLLRRFGIAAVATALLLAASAVAPRGASAPFTLAAALAAVVVFDALTSLAMWGHFRRRAIVIRAPLAAVAIMLMIAHGPLAAIVVFGSLSLISYRWRSALSTAALFRTFLGAAAVAAVLLAPLPRHALAPTGAPLSPVVEFARLVLTMAHIYALVGIAKSFTAFTRDPSLGIRTVSRRLALSHVLVLLVPLAITVTLWVSTTYLGVNADRALSGRRVLDREAAQLGGELRAALAVDDRGAAARRLAGERAAHWPGVRLWLTREGALARVFGDSIPGERHLASWTAGLDTLPGHGVVGLLGQRWLGIATHADAGGDAVILVPVRSVLDSTVAPLIGASFTLREGDAGEEAAADSLAGVPDSLRTLLRESGALQREIAGRRAARRTRARAQAGGPPVVLSVGSSRDSLGVSQALSLGGMAVVTGPEFRRSRWLRSQFMLTARADLRTVLAGLFSNVRENPLQAVPLALLALIVLLLLPVAWLDFAMVGGMGRSIAEATGALREGAAALGRGELAHRIDVRGEDELWETARQFNRMADGLERARETERERDRLEGELELARRIQRRLLPEGPPAIPGLEVAGHSEPAREVGGDYYDHVDLGGGRALVVIADVSGKGVPAALLMSGFRASLMSQDAGDTDPAQLAERTNDFLYRSVDPGKFVTAFFAFLDAGLGRIAYANAGHSPPALRRVDGRVEWLTVGGTVLGILPGSRFERGEAVMEPGDLLLLYTDGVTEGADASGAMWGEERLVGALARLAEMPCGSGVESLVREVRAFEGDTGPADDITVLLVRRNAGEAAHAASVHLNV